MSDQEKDGEVSERADYFNPGYIRSTVTRFVIYYFNNRENIDTTRISEGWVYGTDPNEQERLEKRYSQTPFSFLDIQAEPSKYHPKIPDERFNKLNLYCLQYADRGTREEKEKIELELYPVILQMRAENRIPKDFMLEPFREKELSDIKEKLDVFENRIQINAKLNQKIWKEWSSFKKSLPKGTFEE